MGLFDWFTGTKHPDGSIAPWSPAQVREALLAVNRPTAPFVVRDLGAGGLDLVAEWKIGDENWWAVFGFSRIKQAFRVLMRLDPEMNEVRSVDEEWEVRWTRGIPTVSMTTSKSTSWGRGQMKSIRFGTLETTPAYTEALGYGMTRSYRFSTDELKSPLQDAVTGCGWTWRGALTRL